MLRVIHWIATACLLIVYGLLGGCQTADKGAMKETGQIVKSPLDKREYRQLQLKNGMQVVLVSDPTLSASAAALILPVGSAQDPREFQGLAHLVEHLVLLGKQQDYPEPNGFNGFVAARAGGANAFTHFNSTRYQFSVDSGVFAESLQHFGNLLGSADFSAADCVRELAAVHNEWSGKKQDEIYITQALQGVTANSANPRAQFSIGNNATLKDQPEAGLCAAAQDFYHRYYSAGQMKLTLVGRESLAQLAQLAQTYFGAIPAFPVEHSQLNAPGLTPTQMQQLIQVRWPHESSLSVEFPLQKNPDWRDRSELYVQTLLTSPAPGSLKQVLREQGLIQNLSVDSNSEFYGQDGFMRVDFSLTSQGRNARDKIIAALFDYLQLIRTEGANPQRYAELTAIYEKKFQFNINQDALQQAQDLALAQLQYPPAHLLDGAYFFGEFSAESVQRFLAQLDIKHVRMWSMAADEKAAQRLAHFDASYSISPLKPETLARWQRGASLAFRLPPLNDFLQFKGVPIVKPVHLQPQRIMYEPGVEAWLVHSKQHYQDGNAQIYVEINPAALAPSLSDEYRALYLKVMLQQQSEYLQQQAQQAGLKLVLGKLENGGLSIRVFGYAEKLPQLLQGILVEFERLNIAALMVPTGNYIRAFQQNFPRSQGYEQAKQRLDWLLNATDLQQFSTALNAISGKDIARQHAQLLTQGWLRLLAMGNFNDDQVRQMAAAATTVVRGKHLPTSVIETKTQLPAPGNIVSYNTDTALQDNAILQAWFAPAANNIADSGANKAKTELLNALLFHPFFNELRNRKQLGYDVSTQVIEKDKVPGIHWYVQSSTASLRAINASMDEFRRNFPQQLVAMDERDIVILRESLTTKIPATPQYFFAEADMFLEGFVTGGDALTEREAYRNALQQVTKADLLDFYQALFLSPNSRQVTLQMRGTPFSKDEFAQP